ncbi:TadE/TadG family type IV pilus assembly protein [Demequina globuliformis]|uniref:TadE/TadG family type IV pilus assembly protein n=1 Tax=Demequina globuliformis TaxID=676202 RepID=UPI0007866D2B|nr:TadE/TadG family type IV pilus assembly protein [Demequina globuliformis]
MEFLGVAIIVILVALALIQLVLALHVRNTLASSAYEGATHAALADRGLGDGEARAIDLAAESMSALAVSATARAITVGGQDAVEVSVATTLPLVGLWGPTGLEVTARALEEADA